MKTMQNPDTFSTTRHLVDAIEPDDPVLMYHPGKTRAAIRSLASSAPGIIAYDLSMSSHKAILECLTKNDINVFFVSSSEEIAIIRQINPGAHIVMNGYFKSRVDIMEAYYEWNIRHFCVAHESEIVKILEMTSSAKDIVFLLMIDETEEADPTMGESPLLNEKEAVFLLRKMASLEYMAGIVIGGFKRFCDGADLQAQANLAARVINASQVRPSLIVMRDFSSDPEKRSIIPQIKNAIGSIQMRPDTGVVIVADGGLDIGAYTALFRVLGRRERTIFIEAGQDVIGFKNLADTVVTYGFKRPLRGQRVPFNIVSSYLSEDKFCHSEAYLPIDIAIDDWIEIMVDGDYTESYAKKQKSASVVISNYEE